MTTDGDALYVTPAARQHMMQQGRWLRIKIKSGGCSGLKCTFSYENQPAERDVVIPVGALQESERYTPCTHDEGIPPGVLADPLSWVFTKSARLDYVEEIMKSQFTLVHPKATQRCGCGDSFFVPPESV